jgi:hypothetical protein
MAFPAFTGGVANIKPAAFLGVYVRESGGKWQTLGSIEGGVLNIKDFSAPDSLKRNKAINCYDFTAKCRMKQAALIELELLDSLCNGANDFLFKLTDAVTPAGAASAGWIQVTAAQVGVKAKLVMDGDPSTDRHIELDWQGSIYKSDANEVLLYTPTLAAADFASTATTGTFCGTSGVGGIGTYTATTDGGSPTNSHLKPNGLASVTLDLAGGSSPVTIAPITNVKMSFEMVAQQDGIRRWLPCSLDINAEYDVMASLNADLLLLGNMSVVDVKAILTSLDGLIVTLDNQVGIETNFEVSGDMDKNRIIRITHKGAVLQSSFDGIVS